MPGHLTCGVSRHLPRLCQRSDASSWFSRIVSELVPADLRDWTRADLRRKDAIMERFVLDRQRFQPFLENHSVHLSTIVPDQRLANRPADSERRRALGFIQYEKETGRVTIANECMQLPINALGIGFSTKDVHDHLVGRHGEGLKLAALGLSQEGYRMSIAASGCNWSFDMHADSASISCTVTPSQNQGDRMDLVSLGDL